jgi:hypothetical protein
LAALHAEAVLTEAKAKANAATTDKTWVENKIAAIYLFT